MPNNTRLPDEEYNEPVYYCKECHSLHILIDEGLSDADWDGSYCGKCFSPHVAVCKFGEWYEEEERREIQRLRREWEK